MIERNNRRPAANNLYRRDRTKEGARAPDATNAAPSRRRVTLDTTGPSWESEPMTKTITPPNQTNFYQWTVGNEVGINAGTLGSATVQTNEYSLFMIGANDTLNNSGAILNGLSGHAAIGVKGSGDVITNQGTGTIAGAADGDGVYNAYSSNRVSITNYGLIASGQGPSSAIVLHGGGFVSNASSGTLTGSGVYMGGATGTVVNAGRISGDSTYGGVYLTAGGLITNLGGGTISANGAAYGVQITGGAGTVTNAGTINGGSGFAVELAAGNTNRVIVDQGAVFLGTVSGGSSAGSTLELTSGSSAGTLSGFNGSSITNFGTLAFDMGADWTVSGTSAASGLGSIAITGFTAGRHDRPDRVRVHHGHQGLREQRTDPDQFQQRPRHTAYRGNLRQRLLPGHRRQRRDTHHRGLLLRWHAHSHAIRRNPD